MQTNFNIESKSASRKQRMSKPPRDTEQEARKQEVKRGRQWQREDKRAVDWDSFGQ